MICPRRRVDGLALGLSCWPQLSVPVGSPRLPGPPLCPPQCEEVQATVQKHMHSPRHSKEELNRLNQAIQRLTAEVDGVKSQVRGGWGGGAPG